MLSELTLAVFLAGFAGGMLGAAIGALPALSLAGLLIVVGEATRASGIDPNGIETPLGIEAVSLDAIGLTGSLGFGPVLGPHVAFAGGVAAAAYVGRKETFDTAFRYHQAKSISKPVGSDPKLLLVGGAFGVLGVLIARLTAGVGAPVDPVMFAVVISAFVHRLAFGYPLVGRVRNLDRSILDMSPFERDERWGEDGYETVEGTAGRQVVEPWLPDHYEWGNVALLGVAIGIASGYIALVSGSVFLAFGITAVSLAFLSLGLYSLPVTHHMALPASIAALAIDVGAVGGVLSDPVVALLVAGLFGVLGALVGEFSQRVLYAHADTHLDPPAVSIVVTSLLITVLATAGIFDPGLVPYPVL